MGGETLINEGVAPSESYRGPVKAMNPGYGAPYYVAPFCPNCGSARVRNSGYRNYRCQSCGRKFIRGGYADEDKRARFTVFLNGYETEGGPYSLSELHDAIWTVFTDGLDVSYLSEKTLDYYSGYIEELVRQGTVDDSDDGRSNAEAEFLYDLPFAETDEACKNYIPYLGPGEVFNFPDFPISVRRVDTADSAKTKKTSLVSFGKRKSASKKKRS